MQIRDQTAHSVQSDLDLHCPQKLLVSSSVRNGLSPAMFGKVFNGTQRIRYSMKLSCMILDADIKEMKAKRNQNKMAQLPHLCLFISDRRT